MSLRAWRRAALAFHKIAAPIDYGRLTADLFELSSFMVAD
jgi:hypothetical protein